MAFGEIKSRSYASYVSTDDCAWDGVANPSPPTSASYIDAGFTLFDADIQATNIFGVVDCSAEFFTGDLYSGSQIYSSAETWTSTGEISLSEPYISATLEPFTLYSYSGAEVLASVEQFTCLSTSGASVSSSFEEITGTLAEIISFALITNRSNASFINSWDCSWYGIDWWDLEILYGITAWTEELSSNISATFHFEPNITADSYNFYGEIYSGASISTSALNFDCIINACGNIESSFSEFVGEILGCGGIEASFSQLDSYFYAGAGILTELQLWNGALETMASITATINEFTADISGEYAYNKVSGDFSGFVSEINAGGSVNSTAEAPTDCTINVFFGQLLGINAYTATPDGVMFSGAICDGLSFEAITGGISGTISHIERMYADLPLWECSIDAYIDGDADLEGSLRLFNSSITGFIINPATISGSSAIFRCLILGNDSSDAEISAEFYRLHGIGLIEASIDRNGIIDSEFEEFHTDNLIFNCGYNEENIETDLTFNEEVTI